MLTLELAVRFGKTLLIREVNRIDPILYPVLRQAIQYIDIFGTISGTFSGLFLIWQ